MSSLTSSSSSSSSKQQEVVLHPCRRRRPPPPPPPSLLSSSPTFYLLDDEGRHRVSRLEKMVRVLKRMHSSLRREYWSSPPTSDELRLHHLILIHVTSYISLFDIEQSEAFPPSQQQQGDYYDDDPEELNDALDIEGLPAAFSSFLQESRKSACPRPEDDPLLKDTWALKSMMEDNARNGEKKEELLRILSDLEAIGRSRGYAPPLMGLEIECYREIRNWAIFSILFVNSCALLQSDALTPGLNHFSCVPEARDHFITHTPLGHGLSAAFEMIPFRRSFLQQCRRRISRILETEEDDDDDVVDADAVHENAEYNNDVDGDLVMEGGEAVGISNNTSGAAEAHQDIRGAGGRTPLMISRVECLRAIVSKFLRIGSLPCCPNPPTKEEARLYAQIAEHVYSSLWLFRCAEDTQQTSTGTGSLKTIDASDAWDYSNPDSDPSAARGNNEKNMRAQYLKEIVLYLEAMKSSCLGVIPTPEEKGYYRMLHEGINHSFMSYSVSRDACVDGAGKMKQSSLEEMRASLKSHLVSVCKSQMKFYKDAKKESASIMKLVQSAVMAGDDERDVEDYGIPTDEDVKKVKEFLGEPRSEERLRQLNELIVILNELLYADLATSSMLDVGREEAFAGYSLGEDCCEIVARELLLF